MNDAGAKRLADALLSIAKDEGKVKAYKEAFLSFVSLIKDNEDLNHFLESYFVELSVKEKTIDELCQSYQLVNFTNFMKLLVKKHYFGSLNDVMKEFIKGANEELGILEGILYSVTPLNKDEITKIEEALTKKNGVKVELKNVIDERLLGGIKVAIHDYVYDGSLLHKLVNMKNSLLGRE